MFSAKNLFRTSQSVGVKSIHQPKFDTRHLYLPEKLYCFDWFCLAVCRVPCFVDLGINQASKGYISRAVLSMCIAQLRFINNNKVQIVHNLHVVRAGGKTRQVLFSQCFNRCYLI